MGPIYVLYQTTCKVNGKIYVGVHKTRNANDRYLGSGLHISAAIQKYGRESFEKKILAVFTTPLEAYAEEAKIVNEEFLQRDDVMNIALGGRGGILGEEIRVKMRESHIGLRHRNETRQNMSKRSKGENNPFYGKRHTGDTQRFSHQKNVRSVTIDGTTYASCKEAAKSLGVSPALVSKWIKWGKAVKAS
jgi:group I intron endonuclease